MTLPSINPASRIAAALLAVLNVTAGMAMPRPDAAAHAPVALEFSGSYLCEFVFESGTRFDTVQIEASSQEEAEAKAREMIVNRPWQFRRCHLERPGIYLCEFISTDETRFEILPIQASSREEAEALAQEMILNKPWQMRGCNAPPASAQNMG